MYRMMLRSITISPIIETIEKSRRDVTAYSPARQCRDQKQKIPSPFRDGKSILCQTATVMYCMMLRIITISPTIETREQSLRDDTICSPARQCRVKV